MTKRIVVKAFGGPFDGTHVSDFDTDYGLLPPNRFVAEMHRIYNSHGIGSSIDLTLSLPKSLSNSSATTRKVLHQYEIQQANETSDLLFITASYVRGTTTTS